MQTIAIRLRARDLSAEMAEMRKWLDEHRCEPSNFTFRRFGILSRSMPCFGKMLMVRRSKRASTVGRNDRNRIPSLKIWSRCSPKIPASEMATNPS
jgi:hypothetical protein